MKLATFLAPGSDSPLAGVVADGRAAAMSGGLTVVDVLAGAEARTGDESWALEDVTLLAPVPEPGTVYAIGLNYAEHVAETGGQRPEVPIVFVKVRARSHRPAVRSVCPRSFAGSTTRVS